MDVTGYWHGDRMSALVRNSSTVDDHTVGIQNSAAPLSPWLQQQSFYGPLSGTTWVSWYRKKHSPTHHPDHHPVFISFFRLLRSIFHSLLHVHDYWVINRFCTNQALLTCWEVCLWQMLNVGAAHRPKRRRWSADNVIDSWLGMYIITTTITLECSGHLAVHWLNTSTILPVAVTAAVLVTLGYSSDKVHWLTSVWKHIGHVYLFWRTIWVFDSGFSALTLLVGHQ